MALYNELPVFKACYDLLIEVYRFTKDLTREYKYTIGEKLKNETMELTMHIYRANSTNEKHKVLQSGREKVEEIRIYVRLLHDLKQIKLKKFIHVSRYIENISKQLTAWQKSIKE